MKKNIILLHGAIGASDQLEPLSDSLKLQGFETFTFSFSGHGKISFQKDFGIKQFANELKEFIERNNLQGAPIFGYSMGGYIALYLAAQLPSLIGNIVTLGTKLDWMVEGARREIKMLDAKTILEKVPKFAEALKVRHGDNWKLLLERTKDMMIGLGNNNLLNTTTFSKIESKVLMGLADGDTMVTIAETDQAASQIKNAKRFTLSNTKHPIETVNTEQLSNMIREFLAEARG